MSHFCPQSVSCRVDVWGKFGKPLKRAIWNTLGLHMGGGGGEKKILITVGIIFFGGSPPWGGGAKKSGSYRKNFFFQCHTYKT